MSRYTITIKDNETNKEKEFEAIDYIFACVIRKEKGLNYADGSFSNSQYFDLTRLHLQTSEMILQGFRENNKKNEEPK
jgi:hypothetical protein